MRPLVPPAVCLATSVPPALKREVAPAGDLGALWQRRCVASWGGTGWRAISVNPEAEAAALAAAHPGLEIRAVGRSAEAEYGRPFVWIDDLFAALEREAEGELVGLVNSDIELAMSPAERAAVAARARDGALVIYNRTELRHPGQRIGPLYRYGYDLFVMPRAVMRRLDMRGFALGVPWWDYWMALDALLRGVPVVLVQNPSARHLAHAQAWSTRNWERAIGLVVRRIGAARARLEAERARLLREDGADMLTATVMDTLVGAIRFDARAGYMGAQINHGVGTLLGLAIVRLVERHAHRLVAAGQDAPAEGLAA
ncbi:hypothetical protein GCM10010964_17090 [Caldovatus sediminis]|uniref:Uncharacterized protein n=1 Tax=Caldovatus sediminis TaxID=2041189 RepID=A0A8J2ZA26_9PROT|nr:hypothetical protein [Caldovatus sediminis]GGG29780.1 hypothetical protein GCM10010964_17090 [Caldovatus sediminis]